MHFNSGYANDALWLARRQVKALQRYSRVVCSSASCTAMIRDGYARLAAGDELSDLAGRTFELTEFLAGLVFQPGSRDDVRVAYHATCHSLRSLRLGDTPRRLLAAVPGVELVDFRGVQECCGFGGTFAVKNAATSEAILGDKLDALAESGCQVVTAVDSSCLMQIGGGLSRRGSDIRVAHIAELL
jgi:L-lactate dehydrogenase complex protein LldE